MYKLCKNHKKQILAKQKNTMQKTKQKLITLIMGSLGKNLRYFHFIL